MKNGLKRSLALLLSFALILSAFSFAPAIVSAADEEREVLSLKEVYKDYFMIGSVMNPRDNTAKYDFLKFHFNALTPENDTKPDNIWNRPTGNPNFSQADKMVAKVKADGFYTIGHALAWHNQSTNWPSPGLTYEEARAQLEEYISTIAGHFYNDETIRFDAWDVVNEAMRDNPENPTDWRNALRHGDLPIERPAKWYAAYANGGNGWDYVYDAYLFARKYAPNALLNYNDFNDEEVPSKAIAIASMVTELNERYAAEHPEDPRKLIESIGIQGHYSLRLNIDNLEQVLKIYAATGCRICVTELDVQYNGTVGRNMTQEQQVEQATVYAKLFKLYKKYAQYIDRVTFWGVDDSSNWRSSQRPMIFDVSRNPKEAYWAVIDPEGYLGLKKEAPKLTSFTYGDETFDCNDYEIDVNVPEDVEQITFSADNLAFAYDKEAVNVSVQLSDDGKVADGAPCTATVKIAWADAPESFNEYQIHFGRMSAEWDTDINYPDSGYRSTARIRFYDGSSQLKLVQEFIDETGTVVEKNEATIGELPKNASAKLSVATEKQLDDAYLGAVTLKKSLYNEEGDLLMAARVSDFEAPESYYKLATSIEPGKTYIIVSSKTGKAFTHKALQPVPITDGDGISLSKAGYEATEVTVENDIIVTPKLIQDNIRFVFLPRQSPDAGQYKDGYNLLSLVHGGLIQPFIIWRENVDTATAGLYSNATIGDADLDRAVWYNTGFDPETHETTLFLHSASKGLTYVLAGNDAGFVAEGGTGSIDDYKSLGRVKLYEYVSSYTDVYDIRLAECENGAIAADVSYAKAGETVTVTATPAEDYLLKSVCVTDAAGVNVELTETDEGFTFAMPTSSATITAKFGPKPCDGGDACPSKKFTDAPAADNWAHEGIDYCVKNDLMNGTGDTIFSPNGKVTRAQLVTILYRMVGKPETEFKGTFIDVAKDQWYSDAIEWAAANEIVNGVGNGKFNPNGKITREQIATILYRYSKKPEAEGDLERFPDADQVSDYALDAMIWATGKALINGISSGDVTYLAPSNSATRAQLATIIQRFQEN